MISFKIVLFDYYMDEQDNVKESNVIIQRNIVEDYYEGTLLGKGGFGTVFQCNKLAEQNAKYVIKVIDLSKEANKPKMYEIVMNEIFILDILRSSCDEYIMCYIKSIIQDPIIYIVCEYLENYNTLDKLYNQPYAVDTIAKLCSHLLRGLRKLHSLNVYHRDIKPANIMYEVNTLNIKYIDFGFSTLTIDNVINPKTRIAVGTPNYLYPALRNTPQLTNLILEKADEFSLGMVFFLLLSHGKTIYYFLTGERKVDPATIYRYNAKLKDELTHPYLTSIYKLEQSVIDYAAEQEMPYIDFATLMGLKQPVVHNHEVQTESVLIPANKGGHIKRKTRKRQFRKKNIHYYTR